MMSLEVAKTRRPRNDKAKMKTLDDFTDYCAAKADVEKATEDYQGIRAQILELEEQQRTYADDDALALAVEQGEISLADVQAIESRLADLRRREAIAFKIQGRKRQAFEAVRRARSKEVCDTLMPAFEKLVHTYWAGLLQANEASQGIRDLHQDLFRNGIADSIGYLPDASAGLFGNFTNRTAGFLQACGRLGIKLDLEK